MWEPRDGHTFPLKGEVADTRRALHTLRRLSADLCTGAATRTASANPATLVPSGPVMTPTEAHKKAVAGEVLLVDIRHEAEWQATGIAPEAKPISMHQNIADFVKQLTAAAGGDKAKPVALICAEGVRSTHLQRALKLYGFTDVINVAEGMAGGRFGPGWLKAGLPVTPYAPQQAAR